MTIIPSPKMDNIADYYILFHLLAFLLRTQLIILHILQYVAIFHLQVADQIVHAHFTSAIWFLHPFAAIMDIKKCFEEKRDRNLKRRCPIKIWAGSNVSRFFSELNLVAIHAQRTETILREYFSSIDIKGLVDTVALFLTTHFAFLSKNKDVGVESSASSEPETKRWYQNHFLELTKKNMLFAYFQNFPAPQMAFVDIIDTPCSRQASKSDKIEELADSMVSAPLGEPGPPPKTAESYISPFFPDLKALWADRKKRKKV